MVNLLQLPAKSIPIPKWKAIEPRRCVDAIHQMCRSEWRRSSW
jgi:hypothetical protein